MTPRGGRFGNRRVRAGSGWGKTEARCMTRSSICGYFWTATSLGWNLVVAQDTKPSVRRYRHHDIAISTTQCLLATVCIHAANETGPPIATYHHSRRNCFYFKRWHHGWLWPKFVNPEVIRIVTNGWMLSTTWLCNAADCYQQNVARAVCRLGTILYLNIYIYNLYIHVFTWNVLTVMGFYCLKAMTRVDNRLVVLPSSYRAQ